MFLLALVGECLFLYIDMKLSMNGMCRLWDHLGESMDEYFTISIQNEDTAVLQMESESEKGRSGARRGRGWRSQLTNAPDVPPLLSSEVHKIHSYEKREHRDRHGKRSPSPQSQSRRKRSKTDSSRSEQVCVFFFCLIAIT